MRGFWHALRALFLESETFVSGCGGHFIATKDQTKFLGDLHSADCYGGGVSGALDRVSQRVLNAL